MYDASTIKFVYQLLSFNSCRWFCCLSYSGGVFDFPDTHFDSFSKICRRLASSSFVNGFLRLVFVTACLNPCNVIIAMASVTRGLIYDVAANMEDSMMLSVSIKRSTTS